MFLIHIFSVFESCIIIIELLFVHLAQRDGLVIFLLLRARSNLIKVKSIKEKVFLKYSTASILLLVTYLYILLFKITLGKKSLILKKKMRDIIRMYKFCFIYLIDHSIETHIHFIFYTLGLSIIMNARWLSNKSI